MIIGFYIYGQDNDSWMLEDGKPPSDLICPHCGFLNDFDYHNPLYKVKRKNYDFSHPYDIGTVVSQKFKEFCEREGYRDIIFKEFEWSPGFFQLYAKNVLECDTKRSGTRLSKYCETCGNFEEVIMSDKLFLKNQSQELPEGFYRTDLQFGSRNNKNSNIIVDPGTRKKLMREKMKGMLFTPIEK